MHNYVDLQIFILYAVYVHILLWNIFERHMKNENRALTVKEVSSYLGISVQMVYNLINEGKISAFKIGSATRIMLSDLEDFINRQKEDYHKSNIMTIAPQEDMFTVSDLSMKVESFAVEDVSFSFPKNTTLAVIGPSGCGKTLLLRGIAGLDNIASGKIFLGNSRIDDLHPRDRNIGFVFKNFSLLQNAAVDAKSGAKNEKKVSSVHLPELDIDPKYLDKLPLEFPNMLKRIWALGKEKDHAYKMFLMDEPMELLAHRNYHSIRNLLCRLVKDLASTTIVTLNDVDDLFLFADYALIMADGRMVQFGSVQEVYDHPKNATALATLSRYGINHVPITVKNGKTNPWNIPASVEDGDWQMHFRAEEVLCGETGIPVTIESTRFFDDRNQLAQCSIDTGGDLNIIVPIGTEGRIHILPKNPFFFKG